MASIESVIRTGKRCSIGYVNIKSIMIHDTVSAGGLCADVSRPLWYNAGTCCLLCQLLQQGMVQAIHGGQFAPRASTAQRACCFNDNPSDVLVVVNNGAKQCARHGWELPPTKLGLRPSFSTHADLKVSLFPSNTQIAHTATTGHHYRLHALEYTACSHVLSNPGFNKALSTFSGHCNMLYK